MREQAPRDRWIGAAVRLFTVALLACAVQVGLLVVGVTQSYSRGALVFALVFTVLYAMGAIIVRSALVQNQPAAAGVAYGVGVGLLPLGLINLAVTADDWSTSCLDLVLALVVPVALVVMVTVAGVNDPAGRQARSGPSTTLPPRPLQTPPPAVLAELAASAPETRRYIARHPAAYPGLLEWLGSLGDPAVNQALRERGA